AEGARSGRLAPGSRRDIGPRPRSHVGRPGRVAAAATRDRRARLRQRRTARARAGASSRRRSQRRRGDEGARLQRGAERRRARRDGGGRRMNALTAALRARWGTLAPREKLMVAAAAAVVAFALLWMLAIGPALTSLRNAEAQRRTLDLQVQRMANLQAQAQSLHSQPKIGRDEAVRQLELSVRQRLGTTARVLISGDRV